MKKLTHSPGPFSVVGIRPPYTIHATLPDGVSQSDRLATVYHDGDIRLFCAAPDLLAACKLAQQMFYDQVFIWGKDDEQKVRRMTLDLFKAITKAEAQ